MTLQRRAALEYRKRIIDEQLSLRLEAFGATLIVGPKGCGKTTTAKQRAKSFVEFQDEDERENLLLIANTHPSDLLKGEKPRLFDEWQDAPKIWGAIRKDVDDSGKVGQYILTGSSSQNVKTPHTGTLRISKLKMYPMSLFESGESNGTVSLKTLFDRADQFTSCHSDLSMDALKFAVCRGGWPGSLNRKTDRAQLAIAEDLFRQTCEIDVSQIDGIKRNSRGTRALLTSYARNLCTLADVKTILADVNANFDMSKPTFYNYLGALEELMIVEDVNAWNPALRSKTALRSSRKRNFIDPSIAAQAFAVSPSYFDQDYKTLGFLFESLCIRDLKIYSSSLGGEVSYYHDRLGLEADAVLHLADGRYALIEVKLGQNGVDEGARHLCSIENLVKKYNETAEQVPLRLPDLKIVLCASEYGYRRKDGVLVIPIGCLRD